MQKSDRRTLAVLCAAHFVNDSYSSIIFPLLPLLKVKLGLTTGQLFWLAPLYAISSSLLQPLYGLISDRYARRFFAVFAPAITGIFVSMIGLAPSYPVLILLLIGGGFGIGSFHPQGAAMASAAARERRRVGLALFSAMGTMGYSTGPLLIAVIADEFGLDKTYYIAAVGLAMTAFLYRTCPPLPESSEVARNVRSLASLVFRALQPAWKPLLLLYLITVVRSGMQMTTNNYLPFFLAERGYELKGWGGIITIFLFLGGLGGLAGGLLAERVSGRAVTLYSGLLAGPLLICAFVTTGPLSIVFLGLGGFALLSTLPVNVAMAQELVPTQTSTVSALMMGAAWGVGALCPPLLDNLVPRFGFKMVLVFAAGATMISAVFAFLLPRHEARKLPAVETKIATATTAGD
jgi:FSR family fosmidomycin resistance protein-like MFS transporter